MSISAFWKEVFIKGLRQFPPELYSPVIGFGIKRGGCWLGFAAHPGLADALKNRTASPIYRWHWSSRRAA